MMMPLLGSFYGENIVKAQFPPDSGGFTNTDYMVSYELYDSGFTYKRVGSSIAWYILWGYTEGDYATSSYMKTGWWWDSGNSYKYCYRSSMFFDINMDDYVVDYAELHLTGTESKSSVGDNENYYVCSMVNNPGDMVPPIDISNHKRYIIANATSFDSSGVEVDILIDGDMINENGWTGLQVRCASDVSIDSPANAVAGDYCFTVWSSCVLDVHYVLHPAKVVSITPSVGATVNEKPVVQIGLEGCGGNVDYRSTCTIYANYTGTWVMKDVYVLNGFQTGSLFWDSSAISTEGKYWWKVVIYFTQQDEKCYQNWTGYFVYNTTYGGDDDLWINYAGSGTFRNGDAVAMECYIAPSLFWQGNPDSWYFWIENSNGVMIPGYWDYVWPGLNTFDCVIAFSDAYDDGTYYFCIGDWYGGSCDHKAIVSFEYVTVGIGDYAVQPDKTFYTVDETITGIAVIPSDYEYSDVYYVLIIDMSDGSEAYNITLNGWTSTMQDWSARLDEGSYYCELLDDTFVLKNISISFGVFADNNEYAVVFKNQPYSSGETVYFTVTRYGYEPYTITVYNAKGDNELNVDCLGNDYDVELSGLSDDNYVVSVFDTNNPANYVTKYFTVGSSGEFEFIPGLTDSIKVLIGVFACFLTGAGLLLVTHSEYAFLGGTAVMAFVFSSDAMGPLFLFSSMPVIGYGIVGILVLVGVIAWLS